MSYQDVLAAAAHSDPRVVVLTAENRAAIRALPAVLGPRFVDVGIAEQTMVGMAAGLALRGRVPVAHALATFLTLRAFEFIRTDVGIPGLPVKLVGYVPGLLSEANGPTHQALEDVGLMRGIPGMRVFAPGDEEDLCLGLPGILEDPFPWYIRFNARPAPVAHAPFAIGRAERFGEGSDVAILTYGTLLTEALEAAELLRRDGLAVRVVHVRTLKPLDEEALFGAAAASRLVVTLEDHFLAGGLHTLLAELCTKHRIRSRVLPIAFDERWFRPALFAGVLSAEGLRGDQIAERIRNAWDRPETEEDR